MRLHGLFIHVAAIIFATILSSPIQAGSGETPFTVTSVPREMSYQGILKDAGGDPVTDSIYSVTFRILDVESGGSSLWDQTLPCTTSAGYFTAIFSNVDLPFDEDYWLELEIDSEILDPRQKFRMVGYAARADTADYAIATSGGVGGWVDDGTVVRLEMDTDSVGIGTTIPTEKLEVFGNLKIDGKATIGPGHTNSGNYTFVAGIYNTATGDQNTIAGGTQNVTGNSYSTVGGGTFNSATDYFSTVSGGENNIAGGLRSTVSGGSYNKARGWNSVVSGGGGANPADSNSAIGDYSTIGGGWHNTANGINNTISGGQGNSTSNFHSTVGGGAVNSATDYASTVSGGETNAASGYASTVGGGENNTASGPHSVVGGGMVNTASEYYSTVGGGVYNKARGWYSVVSGGGGATAVDSNSAIGNHSAIGGGYGNIASGPNSTITGGQDNTASGINSAVGAGANNTASGGSATVGGGQSNNSSGTYSTIAGGRDNSIEGGYSAILGGRADTIAATAHYSYLFGIGSKLTQDSTYMVDMPHIRFGDETDGYEIPSSDGSSGQVLQTNGSGQVNWADHAGSHWNVNDSVLYSNNLWGLARGNAQNRVYGDSSFSMVNWGFACTTGYASRDDYYVTIGGGNGNYAADIFSTISGGEANKAKAPHATIGGGKKNEAYNICGTICGGRWNYIGGSAAYAAICGGDSNIVNNGHLTFIGGGQKNIIISVDGSYSSIVGGDGNTVDANRSFIGGGYQNQIHKDYNESAIVGGREHDINAGHTVVGGGYNNDIYGYGCGIFSGVGNEAGDIEDDTCAFIGGGLGNDALSKYSTISGGRSNSVEGSYSCIVGGYSNDIASGADYSYLFGIDSDLTEDSTFMVDVPHIRFGDEVDGYEFPPSDGSAGQVMVTDGNGQLSWSSNIAVGSSQLSDLYEIIERQNEQIAHLERRIAELEQTNR